MRLLPFVFDIRIPYLQIILIIYLFFIILIRLLWFWEDFSRCQRLSKASILNIIIALSQGFYYLIVVHTLVILGFRVSFTLIGLESIVKEWIHALYRILVWLILIVIVIAEASVHREGIVMGGDVVLLKSSIEGFGFLSLMVLSILKKLVWGET